MNAELKIVLRNASKVAKRYKRKCWWSDEEDLRQEASLHQLKAVPHYDVEKAQGVPLEGYLCVSLFFLLAVCC